MNVNIPDEPTYENIKRVLDCMELSDRQKMRVVHAEANRFDVQFFSVIQFKDSADDNTALSPIMTTKMAKRLIEGGEELTFKVIRNEMTPDAPLNFNYCNSDMDFRPPVGPFRQLT